MDKNNKDKNKTNLNEIPDFKIDNIPAINSNNELEAIPPMMFEGIRDEQSLIKDFRKIQKTDDKEKVLIALNKEQAFYLKQFRINGRKTKQIIEQRIQQHFDQVIAELCLELNIDSKLLHQLYLQNNHNA